MYLNLDLLHVVDNYTFPLFYYKNVTGSEVYSPMTLKSVWVAYFSPYYPYFFDYKTLNWMANNIKSNSIDFEGLKFREKGLYLDENINSFRCEPFKLSKEAKKFLKSNKRINKN